jgi:hypothetical protein
MEQKALDNGSEFVVDTTVGSKIEHMYCKDNGDHLAIILEDDEGAEVIHLLQKEAATQLLAWLNNHLPG